MSLLNWIVVAIQVLFSLRFVVFFSSSRLLCTLPFLSSLFFEVLFGRRERAGLLGNLMFAAHSTVPAVTSGRRNAGAKSPSLCLSDCLSVCFSLSSELCEQGGTHTLSLSLSSELCEQGGTHTLSLISEPCEQGGTHTIALSLSSQSCVNKEVHSLSQLRAV